MLSTDNNKPTGKSSQRSRKRSKKAEPNKAAEEQVLKADQVPDQLQDTQEQVSDAEEQVLKADQLPDQSRDTEEQVGEEINEQVSAPLASIDSSPAEASATDIVPVAPVGATAAVPLDIHAIANAYGDYTRKSVEQTWAFFEKLAAARSVDEALKLQTEFVRQAFETFFAESRKFRELHSELARQRVVNFEGFVAKITQTTLVVHATRH